MTYFKLFFDMLDILEPLNDAERGRLLTALLEYANSGEVPHLTGNERFIFPMFKRQLDRDQVEFEQFTQRQTANGRKGGRPKASGENPVVSEQTQKSQDEDKEKEKEKDKPKDEDEDKDKATAVAVAVAAWGERTGCSLSNRARRELAQFVEQLGPECCQRAFDAAQDAGKNNWAYVRGILRTKQDQGVRSLEDWDRVERSRDRGKSGSNAPCQPDSERAQKNSEWLDQFLSGQKELVKIDKKRDSTEKIAGRTRQSLQRMA